MNIKNKRICLFIVAVVVTATIIIFSTIKNSYKSLHMVDKDYIWGDDQVHINITLYSGSEVTFYIPYMIVESRKNERIVLKQAVGENIDDIIMTTDDKDKVDLEISKGKYIYQLLPLKVKCNSATNKIVKVEQLEILVGDEEEKIVLSDPFVFEYLDSSVDVGVSELFSSDGFGSGNEMNIREALRVSSDNKLNKVFINDFVEISDFILYVNDRVLNTDDPMNIDLMLKPEETLRVEFVGKQNTNLHDFIFTSVCYEFEEKGKYVFPIYQDILGNDEEINKSVDRLYEELKNEK